MIALLPLILANNLTALFLALFIAGLLIAPTSIAGQILTKQILPAGLLSEGMSIVVTAMILGMAGGSWLAGLLIDWLGIQYANGLPAIAALGAFVIVIMSL